MSEETQPRRMPVDELAKRCQEETSHYFKRLEHNDQYCFELFRRAIQEQDTLAWETICTQYESLVAGWVSQHSGFQPSGEEVGYFVNGAFGKISGTLSPEKFGNFSDLGYLLRYLKMCVHSVIADYNRAADYADLSALDEAVEEESHDPSPEEEATAHSDRQTFWEITRARLHDEKERLVVHSSYVLDLKPQEIYDHFQNAFRDVDEVYRVKQNVIARLRRDSEFRKLLGMDD
jgi:hypothetical protein